MATKQLQGALEEETSLRTKYLSEHGVTDALANIDDEKFVDEVKAETTKGLRDEKQRLETEVERLRTKVDEETSELAKERLAATNSTR